MGCKKRVSPRPRPRVTLALLQGEPLPGGDSADWVGGGGGDKAEEADFPYR